MTTGSSVQPPAKHRHVRPRVNLIQDGVVTLGKPTSETSIEELTEIVVEQYMRAWHLAA